MFRICPLILKNTRCYWLCLKSSYTPKGTNYSNIGIANHAPLSFFSNKRMLNEQYDNEIWTLMDKTPNYRAKFYLGSFVMANICFMRDASVIFTVEWNQLTHVIQNSEMYLRNLLCYIKDLPSINQNTISIKCRSV